MGCPAWPGGREKREWVRLERVFIQLWTRPPAPKLRWLVSFTYLVDLSPSFRGAVINHKFVICLSLLLVCPGSGNRAFNLVTEVGARGMSKRALAGWAGCTADRGQGAERRD